MFGTGIASLYFCLCCFTVDGLVVSAHGQDNSGYHQHPPPVNLSLTSSDFKTILKWAYVGKSPSATTFTVETMNYRTGHWQLFSPCSNISSYSCDVTEAFSMNLSALSSYYAKVKAVTHFHESQFASTARFSFKENATLSAPIVDIMVHGKQVTLRCMFPHIETRSTEASLNINKDFKCNICVGQEGHNILANCSIRRSRLKLRVRQSRITLCVSAQVNSENWQMKAEWSSQRCFRVQSLNLQDTLIVLFAVVGFILGIASVSILWKLSKKKLVLPKSLVLIVKAINPLVEKIEEDTVSVVIKYEELIPVAHDLISEEVAKPSTCAENREPPADDPKYAGKICAYDRPQNLENIC
ncbi:uncharacterized protein LOC144594039 [Rhinoraja longicauda]